MPKDDAPAPVPRPSSPREPGVAGAPFPYMRWAKAYLGWDEPTLGMSGLAPLSAAERARYGMAPPPEVGDPAGVLKAALAGRYGLQAANVHPAAGTSHANFLAYLTFARGAHVAAETPAYESLHGLAGAVGATLSTFRRRPEDGWRIDHRDLAHAVQPGTRLIVVTDLHNPSGKRLAEEDLAALVAAAEAVDAVVLVDEVYADFDPHERPTAALASPRVVTTNSLTKAHGLPDLRAGWLLGSEEHVRELECWDDLVHPVQPPAGLLEAKRFLPHAREGLDRVRAEAAARAAQVDAWVQATPRVWWTPPDGGLTGFVRLGAPDESSDGDAIALRLYERAGVRVVPGSFFQMPGWLRLSFLQPADVLARALAALAEVLETTEAR